jgi:ABC-type dipeptide/oligopeptide/nickel transport system permease subunit
VPGGRFDLFIATMAVGPAVMVGTAIGCSDTRLIFRHLLPNALGPIVTQSTMNLSWAILNAAGLSFMGLGVQPPTLEWGVMISEGSPYIVSGQWWMSFFPGAALMLMTAGFILIGDGINAHAERCVRVCGNHGTANRLTESELPLTRIARGTSSQCAWTCWAISSGK